MGSLCRLFSHLKNTPLEIERKRLFFDVETSPNIGMFWEAGYKKNIPYENIIKERAIICICYKWEGDAKVNGLTWDKRQNDKSMLSEFIKIANSADELIGHNGDRFDLPWIRTRCLYHRIPMFPQYQSIDTLKISRSKFRFNSNRLDYIAKFLGFEGKIKTDFDLWKKILLDNDRKELIKMVDYCKNDVQKLEDIYIEMKNHIPVKVNFAALYNDDRGSCPECGSDNITVNQTRTTAKGTLQRQYRCRGCGKIHSKNISRKAQ